MHCTNCLWLTFRVQDYVYLITIALKGVIWDFFTVSSLRRELSLKWPERNRVQITCNTSGACHMHHVMLRATWYEGTAQLLSLTEFKSHLYELYFIGWTINQWRRGGNRSTRRKPLATSFRKCHILKPEDSNPKRDLNLHNSIGGRLGKLTHANHYTTRYLPFWSTSSGFCLWCHNISWVFALIVLVDLCIVAAFEHCTVFAAACKTANGVTTLWDNLVVGHIKCCVMSDWIK